MAALRPTRFNYSVKGRNREAKKIVLSIGTRKKTIHEFLFSFRIIFEHKKKNSIFFLPSFASRFSSFSLHWMIRRHLFHYYLYSCVIACYESNSLLSLLVWNDFIATWNAAMAWKLLFQFSHTHKCEPWAHKTSC